MHWKSLAGGAGYGVLSLRTTIDTTIRLPFSRKMLQIGGFHDSNLSGVRSRDRLQIQPAVRSRLQPDFPQS